MDVTHLRATLQTAFIGCQIEHHTQVPSTNDIGIARGKAGAAEGTLIIAEHQTRWTRKIWQEMECATGKESPCVRCA